MDQEYASNPYHGLIMYIHNDTQLLNITMFPGKDIEGIQVVIKKFSKVFTIIGIYSSPHTKSEQIHTFLDNILSNANDEPIIMIDFNIDLSVKQNSSFSKFMKSKYNLDQYMKEYTKNTKQQLTFYFLIIHIRMFLQCTLTGLITMSSVVLYIICHKVQKQNNV